MSINLKDIQLIVCDLDDTLAMEADFVVGGFRAVAERLAKTFRCSAEAIFARLMELKGANRRDVFQAVWTEFSVAADLAQTAGAAQIAECVELYRTADRSLTLVDDAERFLVRAREAGRRLAVLTDGPRSGQATKVRLLKLESRVDRIIYTADLGENAGKPSPIGFEALQREFGVNAGKCVYIADNERKDFVGPNDLGWRTVKIVRPRALYADFVAASPTARPQCVVTTLDEVEV